MRIGNKIFLLLFALVWLGGCGYSLQGNLPGAVATAGLAIVIAGVAMVTHPRAEATPA